MKYYDEERIEKDMVLFMFRASTKNKNSVKYPLSWGRIETPSLWVHSFAQLVEEILAPSGDVSSATIFHY